LVLIDAGLPWPRTQIQVYGEYRCFVARIDMGYENVLVGIEYDGPQHWEDPAVRQRDIDKQVAWQDLGWKLVRASRDLLKFRRSTFVERGCCASRPGRHLVSESDDRTRRWVVVRCTKAGGPDALMHQR
jgi:hypothetical protein